MELGSVGLGVVAVVALLFVAFLVVRTR